MNNWAKTTRKKLLESRTKEEEWIFSHLPPKLKKKAICQYYVKSGTHQYFIDIYIKDYKVAIEIDGSSHSKRQEKDKERDFILKKKGIKTLRISNSECYDRIIVQSLYEAIKDSKNKKKEKVVLSENRKERLKRQREQLKMIYEKISANKFNIKQ